MKWEIEGNRVIPKSLNVACLHRSRFNRTLTFHRVRVYKFRVAFDREFGVYTLGDVCSPEHLSIIDGLATRFDLLEANMKECKAEQDSRMDALRSTVDGRLQKLNGASQNSSVQIGQLDVKFGQLNSAY